MKLYTSQCFVTITGVEIFLYFTTNVLVSGKSPPLELFEDQHTWKHTCKLEIGSHDETSSVVNIYT